MSLEFQPQIARYPKNSHWPYFFQGDQVFWGAREPFYLSFFSKDPFFEKVTQFKKLFKIPGPPLNKPAPTFKRPGTLFKNPSDSIFE